MNFENQINNFKNEMLRLYKENDCTRPVKNSKSFIIWVQEYDNQKAAVELYYDEKFRRMFGQHNTVRVIIFEGDLKEACQIARDLKEVVGKQFSIKFLPFENNEFKTEFS